MAMMRKLFLMLLCISGSALASQSDIPAQQELPWYKKHKKLLIIAGAMLGVLKGYDLYTQLPPSVDAPVSLPKKINWFSIDLKIGDQTMEQEARFSSLQTPLYKRAKGSTLWALASNTQPSIGEKLWGHGIELRNVCTRMCCKKDEQKQG
jgi:hypothetical protein